MYDAILTEYIHYMNLQQQNQMVSEKYRAKGTMRFHRNELAVNLS